LKISLLLIKMRSKQKNAEQVDQTNRSGVFERCNVVSVIYYIYDSVNERTEENSELMKLHIQGVWQNVH